MHIRASNIYDPPAGYHDVLYVHSVVPEETPAARVEREQDTGIASIVFQADKQDISIKGKVGGS